VFGSVKVRVVPVVIPDSENSAFFVGSAPVADPDARHGVPYLDWLRRHIYAPEEIAALVSVADRAASWRCRVPGQYRVLFGLVAATGMRISEALGLDIADLTPDGLLIREAKRRGRRLLPLHPSVEVEFKIHLARRARVRDASDAIFLGDRGGRPPLHFARSVQGLFPKHRPR
jgi:integrase